MTRQTKIVTGLLAGAALGAVVALAISTDKNDLIKAKVSDWLSDLLSSSKEKLAAVGSLVKDNLAKVNA